MKTASDFFWSVKTVRKRVAVDVCFGCRVKFEVLAIGRVRGSETCFLSVCVFHHLASLSHGIG